jgi:hypothetical protein
VFGEVINESKEIISPRERRRKQTTQIIVNKLQRGRGMLRGMFVKTVPMIFSKNTTNINTISTRNKRKTGHHMLIT